MNKIAYAALAAFFVVGCGMNDTVVDETDGLEADPDLASSNQALSGLPAVGYHIVTIDSPTSWDAINAVASTQSGPIITSQNRPDWVPADRWARNISVTWFTTGEQMADTVNAILSAADAPSRVMIDELRGQSIELVRACAARMAAAYPQWRGRWGVYIVNGTAVSYANLNPAIDAVLDADGELAAEMYVRQSDYCAAGSTVAARDAYLTAFFRGGEGAFPQARFKWLAARKTARASASRLSVLFGVTDDYGDGSGPAKFIDRMFYVWANKSQYRSIILIGNGGPGAWKWQQPYTSNTSRDAAFVESLQHYSIDGSLTSRLGTVSCP